jgi:ribonuclease VapC
VSAYVLDASALLAYLHDEPGSDAVTGAISESAAISAANWAETLSKVAETGLDPAQVARDLEEQGLLDGLLEVVPLTAGDALVIGGLRVQTKEFGLSLGDRACLALGMRLELPILTADREWAELTNVDVEILPIR